MAPLPRTAARPLPFGPMSAERRRAGRTGRPTVLATWWLDAAQPAGAGGTSLKLLGMAAAAVTRAMLAAVGCSHR